MTKLDALLNYLEHRTVTINADGCICVPDSFKQSREFRQWRAYERRRLNSGHYVSKG